MRCNGEMQSSILDKLGMEQWGCRMFLWTRWGSWQGPSWGGAQGEGKSDSVALEGKDFSCSWQLRPLLRAEGTGAHLAGDLVLEELSPLPWRALAPRVLRTPTLCGGSPWSSLCPLCPAGSQVKVLPW